MLSDLEIDAVLDIALHEDLAAAEKSCACGATYSPSEWKRLPLCGHMPDGEGGHLELRNCRCGSTISVQS